MRKIVCLSLSLLLLIAGCTTNEPETDLIIHSYDSTAYSVAIPFEPSELRYFHHARNFLDIGQKMIEHSKVHFSPSKYVLHEGSLLKSYGDDLLALVNRDSEKNPTGLNPKADTVFDIGNNKTVTGPVIINDIFEINFKNINESQKIAGVTLALVVRSRIMDDKDQLVTIAEDKLYNFASNAGLLLSSYFHGLPGLFDTPICIIIYDDSATDNALTGRVIAEGLFDGRSGQFTPYNESTALVPTDVASGKDKVVYNQFLVLKRAVLNYVPENLSIIGKATYQANVATKLKISITLAAKTYTEIYVLTEYLMTLLTEFPKDLLIITEIKNFEKTLVVLRKEANSTTINKIVLD